ncbi:hypothetical protein PlgT1_32 [Lactococcus phage PLgT-1]|uniref:hypothetical protein n=1 Tax=Lactococcus phage PLgT-1 TaxID=1815955 RepID=UPI0007DE067F|nr:hypothetical protein BI048_gp32 [Lactococcus phage PLgT-1]ANA49645.1 hypothetical protein PlgT1_32 [Lactococcus phage PLgT-1]
MQPLIMKQIQTDTYDICAFAFYFIIQVYQQKQGLRCQFHAKNMLFFSRFVP